MSALSHLYPAARLPFARLALKCGFKITAALTVVTLLISASFAAEKPNLVIIFADDLGYNDLGCFGADEIKTPAIDRMAKEGRRFTNFYVAAPTCTPSRAALLTGCYPVRSGIDDDVAVTASGWRSPSRVVHPNAPFGLAQAEVTVAEVLKQAGYQTGMVGKWHLGDAEQFNPVHQGFDEYFGVPYSNDMNPYYYLRGTERLDEELERDQQVRRFTEESLSFIKEHKDGPFFLYVAHAMPHTPLAASEQFRDKSERGLYGDAVAEVDWSTGEILQTLRDLNLDKNTLVIFTSDNGPWLSQAEHGGSAFPFRAGKGTTYEGGMRVPCVVWQPGTVPEGTECNELATALDVMPTFAHLAGAEPPSDRVIDGHNITPLLMDEPGAKTPYEYFYYYFGNELHAVRSGRWKLRTKNKMINENVYSYRGAKVKDVPIPHALYDLQRDPAEQKSVFKNHPEIVERLQAALDRAREDMGDALTGVEPTNVRPVGKIASAPAIPK
ncbi:sulfatase family protein [Adhaeretor mobilis]|uniref:Arylsulfatase n=1 Tax=Adhaeretor mobilis TaxID=1930276 RepID=A0A517N122_9BACT|nr:sulfatase [Adhaeretor mobilis]QDT00824.1 Arylsulfatase [Adhaeretor mobilis]